MSNNDTTTTAIPITSRNTYLLTWNPTNAYAWEDIDKYIGQIKKSGVSITQWSCGNTKTIEPGDRIFLMRLGNQPRGLVASGWAISSVVEEPHWDSKKADEGVTANYVDVLLDVILNPSTATLLGQDELKSRFPPQHWSPQSSGISIQPEIVADLERLWTATVQKAGFGQQPSSYEAVVLQAAAATEETEDELEISSGKELPLVPSAASDNTVFQEWQNSLADTIKKPFVRQLLYELPRWLKQELAPGRVEITTAEKTTLHIWLDKKWRAKIKFNQYDFIHVYLDLRRLQDTQEFLQKNLLGDRKFKYGRNNMQTSGRQVYDFWVLDNSDVELLKKAFKDMVYGPRLPDVSREKFLEAMERFDGEVQYRPDWVNWQQNNVHRYAVRENNRNYPVKKIVELATGVHVEEFNSQTARRYLERKGFRIVELRTEPQLEGPAFVVVVRNSAGLNLKTYHFNNRASGERAKLHEAVSKQLGGGPPVYLVMYSPGPDYGFSGWARVTKISGNYESQYDLELDYHPFLPLLDLKGQAAYLRNKLKWLKNGLVQAFNYRAIRQIEAADFDTIRRAAEGKATLTDIAYSILAKAPGNTLSFEDLLAEINERLTTMAAGAADSEISLADADLDNQLLADARFKRIEVENEENRWGLRQPVSNSDLPAAWLTLAQYRDFVQNLPAPTPAGTGTYTASQLATYAQEYSGNDGPALDAHIFAKNLCQLRLMRAIGDLLEPEKTLYTRPTYVENDKSEALLRLMALGLLLPKETVEESYFLPAIPILRRWHNNPNSEWQPVTNFGLETEIEDDGLRLLNWYAEAGLVERKTNAEDRQQWRVINDALNPTGTNAQSPLAQIYNEFLRALVDERDGTSRNLPVIDKEQALRPLGETEMEERLKELGRELLIDEMVVKRIHRSLVAGRHVVLSGPPGTGKTELARKLPTLFWQEQLVARRVTVTLDKPPVEEETFVREGYLPVIVTATEDWSVRDVVAGIGPRLVEEQEGNSNGKSGDSRRGLSYDIQLGHLTRTIMKNYTGLQTAADLDDLARKPPARGEHQEDGKRYAGVWLVIDEFTRAPVDAAFGSLLTMLGGSDARLAVQKRDGSETYLPVPPDFRIIGTLNSFDRHFLNQLSEALKRRFDFIDVLPPHPKDNEYEHGIAVKRAVEKLQKSGFNSTLTEGATAVLRLNSVTNGKGLPRTVCEPSDTDFGETFDSFKRIFRTIRVFRQLGTAQAEAIYVNLFAGKLTGMSWQEALDTALADSLADQLQVLTRDEQKVVMAFLEYAGNGNEFLKTVQTILKNLPANRKEGMLRTFKRAYKLHTGGSGTGIGSQSGSGSGSGGVMNVNTENELTSTQLEAIFAGSKPLTLPPVDESSFYNRLASVADERGL
jgi:5-methylcytosine-specific restriction enzyme B